MMNSELNLIIKELDWDYPWVSSLIYEPVKFDKTLI